MNPSVTAPRPTTTRPLRVLLLDSIPKWGGGEKWCVETALALRARGHHIAIACTSGSPLEARSREAGLDTWSAPLAGPRGLISAWRLGRYLARERIEAVIGNVGRDLWVGAIACRVGGAKLLQRRGLVRPVKAGPVSRWLYTRAVDRIIVNSLAIQHRMLEGAHFLEKSRFVLIPNGVDTRDHRDGAADGGAIRVRADLGVAEGVFVAAAVGRLAEMKGLSLLLEAWDDVRGRVPGAVLLIVGEGEEESALKSLAARLSLGDSVRFLGFRRDVADLLGAIDVVVIPSIRDEGCSNTLLEAMRQARPAVVTRCGGLPHVVEDGVTGLIVPVGDRDALASAIARLLRDAGERERMGRAARKAVEEHYDIRVVTDSLEALLLSMRGDGA